MRSDAPEMMVSGKGGTCAVLREIQTEGGLDMDKGRALMMMMML